MRAISLLACLFTMRAARPACSTLPQSTAAAPGSCILATRRRGEEAESWEEEDGGDEGEDCVWPGLEPFSSPFFLNWSRKNDALLPLVFCSTAAIRSFTERRRCGGAASVAEDAIQPESSFGGRWQNFSAATVPSFEEQEKVDLLVSFLLLYKVY